MMPNSSVARPTIDSTAPSGSSLLLCGSRDVGIEERAEDQGA